MRKYVTGFLVLLFGTGSWLAVNGIWAETPVLWLVSPECKSLVSILTVAIQLANIGPAIYLLTRQICNKSRHPQLQIYTIYIIYVIGIVSCVLLTVFWDNTSQVFGENHSTALITLTLMFALMDCTSSVTFLPFMALFPSQYLNVLYIGEGLSF